MGVLSDLLATADTFDTSATRQAGSRVTYRQLVDILNEQGDFAYPSGFDVANEVQSIAVLHEDVDGGTFTLVFTMEDGAEVTTGNIAFGANAATILGAINTAFTTATYPAWTNGDIAVAGGALTSAPVTLTFSGASVAGRNHGLTVMDGALLTDGGSPIDPFGGEITQSTAGGTGRAAWAALVALGIITVDLPDQGAALSPEDVTVVNVKGDFPHKLNNDTIRALIEEAAHDDGDVASIKTVLLEKLGL